MRPVDSSGPASIDDRKPSRLPRHARALTMGMLLACLMLVVAAPAALADSRTERPLQLQLDLYGFSVGYHLNRVLYLGYTHQFPYTADVFDRHYNSEDTRIFGQDGVDDVDLHHAMRRAFELRISPWPFGLYFALGYLRMEGDAMRVDYDVRKRIVGDFFTTSGLRVNVTEDPLSSPAAGIGFNHVFDFGLSVGGGLLVATQRPDDAKVTVETVDASPAIPEANLSQFRDEIRDDYTESRVLFHLAVGYNF